MNDGFATVIVVRQSPLDYALELLQRGAAIACLYLGVSYWIRLIGLYEGVDWRFDLMPFYWQMTAAPLAVLFPFAGVGLWMLSSWGPVIWFLCAASEVAMYGLFPELFGSRPAVLVMHGLVAGCYIAIRVLLYVGRRRAEH